MLVVPRVARALVAAGTAGRRARLDRLAEHGVLGLGLA
jgi:hypothetical protein